VAASATPHLFAAQQAALDALMRGMDGAARWVLLIGERGSGKTTVIRFLLDELRLTAASVAVFEASQVATVSQLANGLRDHLGLPHRRKFFRADRSVADIVASQSARRTALVVVVDDANALSVACIEWLARLAAPASRIDNGCYVVLAGTPGIEETASHVWATSGSAHASVQSVLRSMTSAELRKYVEQRSQYGGDTSVKFSEAAIQKLETYSNGRPGLVAELCAQSMRLPTARITNEVSGDAVTEAAERLAVNETPTVATKPATEIERAPRRSVARRVGPVIGVTVLAALFFYVGIRVGLRLMETTTAWLGGSEAARDRSGSDLVRSPNDAARRRSGITDGLGRERTASVAPSTPQTGKQRSAERPERVISVAPSPQQVAALPVKQVAAPSAQRFAAPPAQPVAAPSAQQVAALMARAREGEVGELTRLLTGGISPNVRDLGGFTALMAAIVNDQIPAARLLLDRGADVNARAHGDLTPLMLAVINDRHDAVKLLLERGADVNAQSGAGWTALTFAAWKSDAALERVLLSHGAKPNVIDKQGWRPLEYASPKVTPAAPGAR
jgi:hypothetical protein